MTITTTTMQTTAQVILLILCLLTILPNLRSDFEGRPARAPGGYKGALYSVLALLILLFLEWAAGAFDWLF